MVTRTPVILARPPRRAFSFEILRKLCVYSRARAIVLLASIDFGIDRFVKRRRKIRRTMTWFCPIAWVYGHLPDRKW